MCTGCVQSGLEFAAAGSVVLAAGLGHLGSRARDRLRPTEAAGRRASREAEAATFLEGLDLDPGAVLGWKATSPATPTPTPVGADGELQPA
jgi:hypothetical protein